MKSCPIPMMVLTATLVAAVILPEPVVASDQVLLDVVVRDKKGKLVTDLKPQDLTVLDNGTKQEITNFRLVQGADAIGAAGGKTPLDRLSQIRLVTLVFETASSLSRADAGNNLQTDVSRLSSRPGGSGDTRGSEADQRKIARTAALDFIKAGQGGNVYYSVVAINTRLLVLQPFTTDKAALDKAIDRATSGVATAALVSDSDAIKATLKSAVSAPASQSLDGLLAKVMLEMLRMDAPVIGMDARLSIAAFGSMTQGLEQIPGRKSILYFTTGMTVTPELDIPFRNLIGMANHANVAIYALDTRGVSSVSQNSEAASQLTSAANASAATMRNTSGPVSREEMMAGDNAESAARANVQIPLRELADSTGGFLIGDSNDLRGPLRQVNEELDSYYELFYNPGIKNYDGSFRKIKVEVSRKNVIVHARNGYFALPAELRASGMQPFEVPLLKVISDGNFTDDSEFRAAVVLLRPRTGATDMEILVEVPLHVLQSRTDPVKKTLNVHFSLAALVKNSEGAEVQRMTRDRSLQVTPDQLKMGNFVDKMSLTIPPGKYTLESAVMDRESGKTGARRSEFVIAPHANGVGISSLTAVRSYTPNVKGLDPNDPFQFQGGSITPTLNTSVPKAANSAVRLFFIVYQDPSISAKPGVDIEFLQNGKSLTKVPMPLPAADALGRIPYVMTIPAASIPPGSYEVKATVKQGATMSEASTTVKIEL